MILIGLFSILQALFIPGFLLLYALNFHHGIIRTLILSAAISPLANFILVYGLMAIHFYTPIAYVVIIAIETLLFLYLKRRKTRTYIFFPIEQYDDRFFKNGQWLKDISIFNIILFAAFFVVLVIYLNYFLQACTTVLIGRDSIVSFSGWALELSKGLFPIQTWDYPQLLSANWSLILLITRHPTIQLFIHAFVASFPLLLFMIFIDLAFRKKTSLYILAATMTGLFLYINNHITENFDSADIACTFFAFTTFYLLLTSKNIKNIKTVIYLGGIISASAALTKQSGLYIAITYPVFAYFMLLKNKNHPKPTTLILQVIFIQALLIFPFYLQEELPILLHKTTSSYDFMLKQILPRSILQRPLFFYKHILPLYYNRTSLIIGLILIALGLFKKNIYRNIFIFYVAPFFLLWLYFFSYDVRNLAIIVPFISILASIGILILFKATVKCLTYRKKITLACAKDIAATLFVILIVGWLSIQYNMNYLMKSQQSQQMQIGIPEVNHYLLKQYKDNKKDFNLITNAAYLKFTPDYYSHVTLISFGNPKSTKETINAKKPALLLIIKMLLLQDKLRSTTINVNDIDQQKTYKKTHMDSYVKQKILSPLPVKYKIVFNTPMYLLVKINWGQKK